MILRSRASVLPPHPKTGWDSASSIESWRSLKNLLPLKVDLGWMPWRLQFGSVPKGQKTWKKELRPSLSVKKMCFCWWLSVEKTTSSVGRKKVTHLLKKWPLHHSSNVLPRDGNPSFMVICFQCWRCWVAQNSAAENVEGDDDSPQNVWLPQRRVSLIFSIHASNIRWWIPNMTNSTKSLSHCWSQQWKLAARSKRYGGTKQYRSFSASNSTTVERKVWFCPHHILQSCFMILLEWASSLQPSPNFYSALDIVGARKPFDFLGHVPD